MTRSLLISAALLASAAALPASASTQADLQACKAQLVADGHVDASTQDVRTDQLKRRAIVLEIVEADGTERQVTCRVRRGVVTELEEDGQVLVAKAMTDEAMTKSEGGN